MSLSCSKCGKTFEEGSKFCVECGQNLIEEAQNLDAEMWKDSRLITLALNWAKTYSDNPSIEFDDDHQYATYRFSQAAENGSFTNFLEIYPDRQQYVIYAYPEIDIPETKRLSGSELITRLNWAISLIGAFELDMESGRLRYRGAIDVENSGPTKTTLDNLTSLTNHTLDQAMPAILALVNSNLSPRDAIALVNPGNEPAKDLGSLLCSLTDCLPWTQLNGTGIVQNWSKRVAEGVSGKLSVEDWQLIGHAVAFECEDQRRVKKVLQRVAADAHVGFLAVPGDEVLNFPIDSDRLLLSLAPVIVFLHPGEWRGPSGYDDDLSDAGQRRVKEIDKFQFRLARTIRNFNPEQPVIFATSANNIRERIHRRLLSADCINRIFSIPLPSLAEQGSDFVNKIGIEHCADSLSKKLVKVGKLLSIDFDDRDRLGLAAIQMRRTAVEEVRKVTFDDLVRLTIWEGVEFDSRDPAPEFVRRQTAYHEAGHALIAVVASRGHNIPECTSIVPGHGFGGITAESTSYLYSKGLEPMSFELFRAKIQLCLGGRAGEEIFAGTSRITSGPSGDLEQAIELARYGFGSWGFSTNMSPETSGSNLAILDDQSSQARSSLLDEQIRHFLEQEYNETLKTLIENRQLLDELVAHLMKEPMVDQDEMAEICAKHLPFMSDLS